VRRDRKTGDPRFRALLHAPGEDADYRTRAEAGEIHLETRHPGLRWYSINSRELLARRPAQESTEAKEGLVLPVLTLTGDERSITEDSTNDVCPSCGAKDSIRFLGSAVATLLSVSLTTLFGDDALDDADKRALIFTDSVQDAAHRAGYVNQRSHTMSLRSALRGALRAEMPIEEWAEAALDDAQASAFDRYRLVPATLAEHQRFKPYWDPKAPASKRSRAKPHVRRRLLFDIALEVGLQSTYGRTLEATGSVTVHVSAGRANALVALADEMAQTRGADLDAFHTELRERADAQNAPTVEGVTLSSLHAAKGLEWDAVILAGVCEGLLPISLAEGQAAIEEERRLLYVGVTRAREHLIISYARARNAGGRASRKPSRFLDGLWPTGHGSRDASRHQGRQSAKERSRQSAADFEANNDPRTIALFEELRAWRSEIAKERSRPAYTVFADATLRDIAVVKPTSLPQLSLIRGVGATKLQDYGGPVLALLRDFEAEN